MKITNRNFAAIWVLSLKLWLPTGPNYLHKGLNSCLDLSRSKLQDGDILYSIAGTIGRLIVVDKEILPANVNQALAIIRVNPKKISSLFIKCCLKDRYITENLHSKVVQAVQPNLSLGEIANTTVPFPPLNMMKKFIHVTEPIDLRQKIMFSKFAPSKNSGTPSCPNS